MKNSVNYAVRSSHILGKSITPMFVSGEHRKSWRYLKKIQSKNYLKEFFLYDNNNNPVIDDYESRREIAIAENADIYEIGKNYSIRVSLDKKYILVCSRVLLGASDNEIGRVALVFDMQEELLILRRIDIFIFTTGLIFLLVLVHTVVRLKFSIENAFKQMSATIIDILKNNQTSSDDTKYFVEYFDGSNFLHDFKKNYELAQKNLKAASVSIAIAQTTQMLAHDVRKPFSMIKSLLSLLQTTRKTEQIHDLISTFAPDVERAILSVNGMISDIMEVSSISKPIIEVLDPIEMIITSLTETFQYEKKKEIKLSYLLAHTHMAEGARLKLLRVFSNIISNASQAMGTKGTIWFRTRDITIDNSEFIEFTIGNSGSYIPKEDRENLFEAFYTQGKKSGTGLGLAIAKKVVESHGGQISCSSSENLSVEFVFTIPAANKNIQVNASLLPSTSQEIISKIQQQQSDSLYLSNISKDELTIQTELLTALRSRVSPMYIMVVDDEAIYRELITGMIEPESALSKWLIISAYESPVTAIQEAKTQAPHVILMDVDLGKNIISGFETTKAMRENGLQSKICIHSNRGAFESQDKAISAGANLFLPKPISRHLFLKLLLSVASAEKKIEGVEADRHLIVLDDSALMLGAWENVNNKKELFFSPEEFYQKLETDPSLLTNALCIITDQFFDEVDSSYTGLKFAKKLRDDGVTLPIFLSSDGEFTTRELTGIIETTIPKNPAEAWEQVKKWFKITGD